MHIVSESIDAKIYCQKGNSPDYKLRPLNIDLSAKRPIKVKTNRWVGLEAAILNEVRNSLRIDYNNRLKMYRTKSIAETIK